MDYKDFKYFLNLFQYGDDSRKKECIDYLINKMKIYEKTKKIQKLEKMKEEDLSPNLCLDTDGDLMLDTKFLKEVYEGYLSKLTNVKTEVANLEIEERRILRNIGKRPFKLQEETNDDED